MPIPKPSSSATPTSGAPLGDARPGLNLEFIEAASIPSLVTPATAKRPIWLERVHARVDQALADNYRAERVIVGMALALFLVGLLVVLLAYWLKNPYVGSFAVFVQTLLIFPFNEMRKLRRDNLILQIFPALIERLPKDAAIEEIKILLAFLRGGK
jgi:hypothetical protein